MYSFQANMYPTQKQKRNSQLNRHINNSKKLKIFKAKKSFSFLNNFFIAENGGVFVGSDLKISTLRRR